jgi:hypothetical protein
MIVELDIYSGQPNPTWTLTNDQEQELIQFLSNLSLKEGEMVDHGILGYRGMILYEGNDFPITLVGLGEIVQQTSSGLLVYYDEGKELEKFLLTTAINKIDKRILHSILRDL